MAQQGHSNGSMDTMEMVIYWFLAIAFIAFTVSVFIYFQSFFMFFWKVIRTIELFLSFRFDLITELYQNNIRWSDEHFKNINEGVYLPVQFVLMPAILYFSIAKAVKRQRLYYSQDRHQVEMSEILGVYFKRFKWLSILGDLKGSEYLMSPSTLLFKDRDIKMEFKNKKFVTCLNPYEYMMKVNNNDINDTVINQEDSEDIQKPKDEKELNLINNLKDAIRQQLGPRLIIKNNRVQWRDKIAEQLANQIIEMIPESKAPGHSLNERQKAIELAKKVACFERTYVFVLFSCAKCYGVVGVMNFLWLRDIASAKNKTYDMKTSDPVALWRMLLARARGGALGTVRSSFPESVALCCQYNFEVKCFKYLEENQTNDEDSKNNREAVIKMLQKNKELTPDTKDDAIRLDEAIRGFLEVRDKRKLLIKD